MKDVSCCIGQSVRWQGTVLWQVEVLLGRVVVRRMVSAQVEEALQIFEDMLARGCERNVITYSSLVAACEKAGRWQLALELLDSMHRDACKPNAVTFNALISACAQGSPLPAAPLKPFLPGTSPARCYMRPCPYLLSHCTVGGAVPGGASCAAGTPVQRGGCALTWLKCPHCTTLFSVWDSGRLHLWTLAQNCIAVLRHGLRMAWTGARPRCCMVSSSF